MEACAIGILHTVHLGVALYFVSTAMWAALTANIFGISGLTDEIIQLGVLRLRAHLFDWYKQWDASHPERPACRLSNLTLQMLGDKTKPKLHAKAAETFWLLPWLLTLLQEFAPCIENGKLYLSAGQALFDYMEILRSEPTSLSIGVPQRLLDLAKQHLLAMKKIGAHEYPKHHLFVHLTLRSLHIGNPRSYGTFSDESANGDMAKIAGSNHRSTWVVKSYWKYSLRYGGTFVGAFV
jgi:hypothetical protein